MVADDQIVELANVGGVLLYRDSSDPNLFYYTSTRPAVAQSSGNYQLTLVRYDTPRDNHAAMLSLVVNLEPDAPVLDEMHRQLRAKNPSARCKPMQWSSGTVAAAIIGGGPVFGTPSLLGSNSAVLSVGLNSDQYVLLKESAQRTSSQPISVVYSLAYEAFRPQYEFTIEFNESRFRDWVQKKCSASFLFISAEKLETFDELRQYGVIRVASVSQTTDSPPDGFRRAFLRSLQSVLTPVPKFARPPGAETSEWLIGFDCSTVHDMQSVGRRLDCSMQISGPVFRKAYIQGALGRLHEALAANPEIELATNTRFTQNLTVRCHAAFKDTPLNSVNVLLEPQNMPRPNHVFSEGSAADWPVELVREPELANGYSYSLTLYFNGALQTCSSTPMPIELDWAFLDVLPAEFFSYRTYAVTVAAEFPWELIRFVRVTLSGPEPLAFEPGALTLTDANRSGEIKAFAPRRVNLDDVSFAASYSPYDAAQFSVGGLASGSQVFLNPFRRRRVKFCASQDFDWQQYTQVQIAVDKCTSKPQLWPTSKGRLMLTKDEPCANFDYWFTDTKALTYRTAFIQNGTAKKPGTKESSDACIVVSAED